MDVLFRGSAGRAAAGSDATFLSRRFELAG